MNATWFPRFEGQLELTHHRANGRDYHYGVVDTGPAAIAPPRGFWRWLWRRLKREAAIPASMGLGAFLAWMLQSDLGHGALLGLVTDAGVDYMAGDFAANGNDVTNFNYHETGTGTNAAAVGDTDLQTKLTYARVTGTQSKPGSRQFRNTGTVTYASNHAITEWGLFSAAGSGLPPTGGSLWDRRVFAVVNVGADESVTATYTATAVSGGT